MLLQWGLTKLRYDRPIRAAGMIINLETEQTKAPSMNNGVENLYHSGTALVLVSGRLRKQLPQRMIPYKPLMTDIARTMFRIGKVSSRYGIPFRSTTLS